MRYIFLMLVTLSFAPAQSMDRIKEKWTNVCERIERVDFSRITNAVNKDACLDKLNSFGSFFNSGINRLVDITIHNDKYTTKEKAIIGAGSVGAVASLIGAKLLLKKSRLSKIPVPQQDLASTEDIEKNIKKELDSLATAIDIDYTINGALNNLLSNNPESYESFLEKLNTVRDNIADFFPKKYASDKAYKANCEKVFDQKIIEIVDFMDSQSKRDYARAIENKFRQSAFEYNKKRLDHSNLAHELDNIQFAVKHPKPSQEA